MKNKIKFNVEDEVKELPKDIEQSEVKTDSEENRETILSDEKEQFYASDPKYNELREAMEDTDFRLFLINDDLVIPGTLDGNKIQFLDIVGDDDNKEFVMKDAPKTMNELLDFKTLYNRKDAVESKDDEDDKNIPDAPHQEIVEYILNLKLKDDDAEDVEDDENEIDTKEKEEEKDETNEQQ
jgi:hypothetical protein